MTARWRAAALSCALLAGTASADELPVRQKALFDRLRARVEGVADRLDGVMGVFVEDLATGTRIEVRADEPFAAASSVKLAVLYEAYRQAAEQKLDLAEVHRLPPVRVGGDGVLRHLGPSVSLTWRDLAVLMTAYSDNEATNLLLDRVGMEAVNRRLDGLVLPNTRLRRRMMDLEAARRGEENVSSPRELTRLATLVGRGEGLPPEMARDLQQVATVPDALSAFRRGLPEGQRAVTKLGELEGVRCEAAWVDLPGRPYAVGIMTAYLKSDHEGAAAVAEISAAAFETFDRLARSSDLGRVVSSR